MGGHIPVIMTGSDTGRSTAKWRLFVFINRSAVSSVAKHIRANEVWLFPVTLLVSLMQTDDHRLHDASKGHRLMIIDSQAGLGMRRCF